jgi:hypothetical protein
LIPLRLSRVSTVHASRESPDRLLRQKAEGLIASDWHGAKGSVLGFPDTGFGEVLDERFTGPNRAALSMHRAGARVTVTWDQPLASER